MEMPQHKEKEKDEPECEEQVEGDSQRKEDMQSQILDNSILSKLFYGNSKMIISGFLWPFIIV